MPDAQVTAIVPARNEEATIAAAVESLAAQSVPVDIVVVNDGSSDRTGAILTRMQQRLPRLHVVETGEPPSGWTGKNHALAAGIRLAGTPWLLLTDADVRHRPRAVEKGLAAARESAADLVSFSPDQELSTWWEKAVLPYVYCRLAREYPYERVSNPDDPLAAANGQWLLISRSAYESLGGLAAVRGEVLDDVALARRAKQAGARIYFARGHDVASTRMYRRFGEMWEGWSKNLFPLFGRRRKAVAAALAEALIDLFTLTLVFVGAGVAALAPASGLPLLGAALALMVWRVRRYWGDLRRNHYPLPCTYYYLLGSLLFAALMLNSARLYRRGASVRWKGREYPVAAP
jgi:glycosyltransferase involved in cell wall biosynthesis